MSSFAKNGSVLDNTGHRHIDWTEVEALLQREYEPVVVCEACRNQIGIVLGGELITPGEADIKAKLLSDHPVLSESVLEAIQMNVKGMGGRVAEVLINKFFGRSAFRDDLIDYFNG